MKIIYKSGGDWETDGVKYTAKNINQDQLAEHLKAGWVLDIKAIQKPKAIRKTKKGA
jgi:hypothetical protein